MNKFRSYTLIFTILVFFILSTRIVSAQYGGGGGGGGTPPGSLTDASCQTYCEDNVCKTESTCQSQGSTCHQNGCIGRAIDNGNNCSCNNTGCSSWCTGAWASGCAGTTTDTSKCDCNNGTTCYQCRVIPACPSGQHIEGEGCPAGYNEVNCSNGCCDCVLKQLCVCNAGTDAGVCVNTSYTESGDGSCIPSTCDGSKQPDCSDSGNHCSESSYSSVNGCGNCTGTESSSASWDDWTSCSGCSQSRSCFSTCGGSCSGSNTQHCGDIDGTSGVCGTASGQIFSTSPSSGLCDNGSPSAVSLTDRSYSWTCYGTSAGPCGGVGGSNVSCNATENKAPVFTDLTIDNSSDVNVPSDNLSGGRLGNHICQTQFSSNRIVHFVVNANDPDGNGDINDLNNSVWLKIDGIIYTPISLVNGVATFAIHYEVNNPVNTFLISIQVVDSYGATTGWIDTNHDFKIWDCLVPVSGTVYDGSTGSSCAGNLGYSQPIPTGISWGLSYRLGGLSPRDMTVSSPIYTDGGNKLVWGTNYVPLFTTFPGADPTELRAIDLGIGTTNCATQLNLTNNTVDPYSNNPSLQVDFSSIMDQLAWFQTQGGGVAAKIGVTDSVPVTCGLGNACIPAITTDSSLGSQDNGLVAGKVESNSGCGDSCHYGSPNNWNTTQNLIQETYDYGYLFNHYYLTLGQGITIPGDTVTTSSLQANTNIGGTGVIFINGNLEIDTNNTLAVNEFLMLVVKGNITIAPTVNRVDGVLIGANISTIGKSDAPLVINGMIMATGNVDLHRGFTTENSNNAAPAVTVNYRPDLLFNLPGKLVKTISGWKEGL